MLTSIAKIQIKLFELRISINPRKHTVRAPDRSQRRIAEEETASVHCVGSNNG